MNVITKSKAIASDVRDCIIKKAVPLSVAAFSTINALAVSAFAAEGEGSTGSTGVDISSVTDTITSSLKDLVTKAAIACAAVVGVGLTIFGIKWVVTQIKSFFKKISG